MSSRQDDLFWLWRYLAKRSLPDLRELRRTLSGREASTVRFGKRRFDHGDVITAVNHYIEERMHERDARRWYEENKGITHTRYGPRASRKTQAL